MHPTMCHQTMTHHAATPPQRLLFLARSCGKAARPFILRRVNCRRQQLPAVVRAEGEKQEQETSTPPPASTSAGTKPVDEPIWIRRERERELQAKEGKDLPFGVYLLFSAMVAIAAVGSIFEYYNQHALFDVIQPDNPLWAPILAVFVFTGLPMAGFLFYKAVASANKASEQMDRLDGY